MKDKINSYFAVLLITIVGAGATMIIIHVAYSNNFVVTYGASQAVYTDLQ